MTENTTSTTSTAILIKTTQDGRRVAVIGRAIYLGDKKEADRLVPIAEHPNWEAILQAVPGATHVAGRVPLLAAEAAIAQAALDAAQQAYDNSPEGISERIRMAPKSMLRLRVDE